MKSWKEQFLKEANIPDNEHFPFVVLGNKADMITAKKVSQSAVSDFCNKNGKIKAFEVSAKEDSNVSEAFMHISREALAFRGEDKEYVPTSVIFNPGANFKKGKKNGTCCSG